MEEEKLQAIKRKLNMKLYPIYRMLAADALFWVGIKVLFLTQVKGFSNASVVFMETLYSLFKMLLQVPMSVIVSKLGTRRSVIIGNILWVSEMVLIVLSQNYFMIILSQLCGALAWSCKSIAEAPLLNKSIPESAKKGKIFTKLDGKGYSRYCYISAITTMLSGFLYEINPYIPVTLTIVFMVLALIISMNFIDVKEEETKTIKESLNEVKDGAKFIIKSPRLKSLLITLGFMWGMICLFGTYQTTLLKDINVPARYIGIILAILDIIQGKGATLANRFNEKYKNTTLTLISLRATLGIIVAGVVVVTQIPRIPALAIIIFTYVIRMSDKGVYKVISRRYMGNFMTPEMLTKVYTTYSVIASIFRMIASAIGSYLLTIMTIDYAMVVVGILFMFISLLLATYMKTRIGLQPEEYDSKDVIKV